jgi:hypothetical protein
VHSEDARPRRLDYRGCFGPCGEASHCADDSWLDRGHGAALVSLSRLPSLDWGESPRRQERPGRSLLGAERNARTRLTPGIQVLRRKTSDGDFLVLTRSGWGSWGNPGGLTKPPRRPGSIPQGCTERADPQVLPGLQDDSPSHQVLHPGRSRPGSSWSRTGHSHTHVRSRGRLDATPGCRGVVVVLPSLDG